MAIAGAYAVGCQSARARLIGFSFFGASNLVLILAFILMASWPLLSMQFIFLLTSVRGIFSNYRALIQAQ